MLKLDLSHFGVTYRDIPAIVDLSVTLTSATLVAVSGVLGAGKTSLLRAIEGKIRHSGQLSITDGTQTYSSDVVSRAVPRHLLKQDMTVSQFILLGILQQSWTLPHDADKRIRDALTRCQLSGKSHYPLSALTPDEMRMAELAQLFVQNPRIILIDEPVGQLSANSKNYIQCLSKWVKEHGNIALVAIPHVATADTFDKVIPLSRGHIQAT